MTNTFDNLHKIILKLGKNLLYYSDLSHIMLIISVKEWKKVNFSKLKCFQMEYFQYSPKQKSWFLYPRTQRKNIVHCTIKTNYDNIFIYIYERMLHAILFSKLPPMWNVEPLAIDIQGGHKLVGQLHSQVNNLRNINCNVQVQWHISSIVS